MWIELIKFIAYSFLIVIISKYILVKLLRKLAENLNLKPKTVGNISGVATSVPELLTISFSAATGFLATSVYNVISSNIINLAQYLFSVFLNKNHTMLKNRAIRIDISMVVFTIIFPIFLMLMKIEFQIGMVPILLLLFFLCYFVNQNTHKLYLTKEEAAIGEEIQEEKKWVKGKRKITISYTIYLFVTAVLLFIIGNLLSGTLENLARLFQVPEFVLGIALGVITSIPELITFLEAQKHYRKNKELDTDLGVVEATNNLLTSNLLNLFVIQSIGILIFWFVR